MSGAQLDARGVLERLVAFPTVSSTSNRQLVDWVRDYLDGFGFTSRCIDSADGSKANLIASVGPMIDGGLALSGHTDVVPVEGQAWHSDPFRLVQRSGRLYARGAADMKGYIAAAVTAAASVDRRRLRRPLSLLLSYDEEVGCLGAPAMIAEFARSMPRPAAIIVGEPTDMKVVDSHKSYRLCRTRARGIEAHSSLVDRGVSAVMICGELIACLGRLMQLAQRRVPANSSCEPPYTTISANLIRGGSATNILAGSCEFWWDVRAAPFDPPGEYLTAFEEVVRSIAERLAQRGLACTIETEILADVPGLSPQSGAAAALARELLGVGPGPNSVPFVTEAGQFQQRGYSTVVCGPGSIAQAHRPDEYVSNESLVACETFLRRAIDAACIAESKPSS